MNRKSAMVAVVVLILASCALAGYVSLPTSMGTQNMAQSTAAPTEQLTSPTPSVTTDPNINEIGEDEEETREPHEIISLGAVHGNVINGTTGETAPAGMEVKLVGVDGQSIMFTETSTTDENGGFVFEELGIVPGRILIIIVNYEDVDYFSETTPLAGDETFIELPVAIFEKTSEASQVRVDRLHLLFEFTTQGVVEVTELMLMINVGDHTVISSEDQEVLWVTLPENYSNLRFYDMFAEDRYRMSDYGFAVHGALRPTDNTEWVFSYSLPYDSQINFSQLLTYPVDAVTILISEGGPEAVGDGLEDLGIRNLNGANWRSYALGSLAAEETLTLKLSSPSSAMADDSTSFDILIGVGTLVGAITIIGVWWVRNRSRLKTSPETPPSAQELLLGEIAALDDEFEAGKISEAKYSQRREALKRRLLTLMRSNDD